MEAISGNLIQIVCVGDTTAKMRSPNYNWIFCTKCCGTDEEKSTRVYKIWFETHAVEIEMKRIKIQNHT